MSCPCPFQQNCTLGWQVTSDLIVLMPNFHFFLFALRPLINHLSAKVSLYSRRCQCLPRLYPWQLLGEGSCRPDMLQQTQAMLFTVKDQQGFLSFGGGLLFLFGHGLVCFFFNFWSFLSFFWFFYTFFLYYIFVSSFSLWETALKLLFKMRVWNEKHAEVMQQILKVQISKFIIVRRSLVLTVWSMTFWADYLAYLKGLRSLNLGP